MSFFETITTSSAELRIKIGSLQLTPSDCISVLQAVFIKKDAINSKELYNNILEKSKKVLPKKSAEGLREIVEPLYGKVQGLFRLLISMEDASPLPNVDWAQVDACLIDIDASTKELFKEHANTIWALHYLLVPFFQSFLADPRTKKVVAQVLKEASLQPLIGQMIVNEYEDCGVTVVPMPVNAGYLSSQEVDTGLLEAVLEKISVVEGIAMERSADDSPQYIRDLAYLQVLSTDDFYYQNEQGRQRCRLTALTQEQLNALMSTVMRPCEDKVAMQRATLQTLAILHESYRRITGANLSEKDLASILLALEQSQFELQWQLDADKTSPGALLLYTSLLCLRGHVVHIEQAGRLLALQNAASQSRIFLEQLNIVYTECTHRSVTKIGVLHTRVFAERPHSYYFGSQSLKFSEHPALNLYLAQTLLEMKQRVLQAFDAWYAILMPAAEQSPVLQNYREGLLKNLDYSWIQFISTRLPCQNLQQIDHIIEQFQRDNLVKVWQKTEKKLSEYAAKQTLSTVASARLNFLRTHSDDAWTAQLSQQHFGRYAASLSDLSGYDEGGKHLSQARLHYDRAYLSQEERMHWIQRYLKHHLLTLQRLCPAAKRTVVASEQFEILIHYLAEKCEQQALSPEWVAAMDLCVNLYHCMESILTWSDRPTLQKNIGMLATVSSDMAIQALGRTLTSQIHWVTQTDSFYYRWLESRTVKRAAHNIYDLAQRIVMEPGNKEVLKAFMQALFEQQSILSQVWWYFPFGWFFGYADLRDVCGTALQQVNQMVSLQQIPVDLWQEANEAAQSALPMQRFQLAARRIRVDARQSLAWQTVLQEVDAIQVNHSGFAMVYELQAYLQTQRHKFILCRPGFFYGSIQTDQIAPLLKILDRACCDIEKTTQGAITYRAFVAKKTQQVLARNKNIKDVSIQIGHVNDYFFDMRSQFKDGEVRCKRFYQVNDFFTFARKAGPLEEAELGVSVALAQR